jgi:hypothetical protein
MSQLFHKAENFAYLINLIECVLRSVFKGDLYTKKFTGSISNVLKRQNVFSTKIQHPQITNVALE